MTSQLQLLALHHSVFHLVSCSHSIRITVLFRWPTSTANKQGTAGVNRLNDWQVTKLSYQITNLIRKKKKKKKSASLKKIGPHLQKELSAINNISALLTVIFCIIICFFPTNTWKGLHKTHCMEIFFAHPQHRTVNIRKHRKDCQSLKSSCFHSSFKFQINS